MTKHRDVIDTWLAQEKPKLTAGNVYFRGDAIYNYRTIMGRIVGKTVLLNQRRYSRSTSRVQNMIRGAVIDAGLEPVPMDPSNYR